MTTRDVAISRALSSQADLQKRREHCSADGQPLVARSDHWLAIADAVAVVYAAKLDERDGPRTSA